MAAVYCGCLAWPLSSNHTGVMHGLYPLWPRSVVCCQRMMQRPCYRVQKQHMFRPEYMECRRFGCPDPACACHPGSSPFSLSSSPPGYVQHQGSDRLGSRNSKKEISAMTYPTLLCLYEVCRRKTLEGGCSMTGRRNEWKSRGKPWEGGSRWREGVRMWRERERHGNSSTTELPSQ